MSNEELIAEARERAEHPGTGSNTAQCLRELADALEAATVETEWEYGQGYRNSDDTVFLWTEATSLEHAKELATPSRHKDRECPVPLRRRKAGPWEPVGGESA